MKIFEQKYLLMAVVSNEINSGTWVDEEIQTIPEKVNGPEKFVLTNLVFWPIREIDWGRAALNQRKYKIYRSVANGVTKLKIDDGWNNTIIEINGEISLNEQQSILCAIYPIHGKIDNFLTKSEHVFVYNPWSNVFENQSIEVVSVEIRENPNYKIILDYLDWVTFNKAEALIAYKSLFDEEKLELKNIIEKRKVSTEAKDKLKAFDEEIKNKQLAEKLLKEKISENLTEQTTKINDILFDGLIYKTELDSLDYDLIWNLLTQSHTTNLSKSGNFIKERWGLIVALGLLVQKYNEMKWLKVATLKNHEGLDKLISNMPQIIWNMISMEIWAFSEKIKTMWLDERLHWYKKLDDQKEKQVLIAWVIIEEEITAKWHVLSYTDSWEIIVTEKDGKEIKNDKINKILSEEKGISKEHLKIFALNSIIKSIWLDFVKEWSDYEKVINSILNKNFNKKELVFNDLFMDKEGSKTKLETKLTDLKTPDANNVLDITAINEIQFVLDYIKNQASYPVKVIEQAKVVWVLEKTWFDIKTVDWREKLMKAFSEWKGIKTLMGELMWANWGMVWIAVIGFIIFWLFKWKNYLKTALWLLGFWIFGPALEEMAHKYWLEVPWLWDDSKRSWEWNQFEAQRHFESIDITIPNLPDKYNTAYNNMYRANYEKPMADRIYEQDYAQIFGQLVTNKDFNELNLETIKRQLNNWDTIKTIFSGEITPPTTYIDWLITSEKGEKIAEGRIIDDKKIRRFLNLLVVQADDWDKTVWDIFVENQVKAEGYINWETEFNNQLSAIISWIPLSKLSKDIEEITKETTKIFSLKNLEAIFWDKAKIEQLWGVITKLETLRNWYTDTLSYEYKIISEILEKYTWLKNKKDAELDIATFESETRKNWWLRAMWVEEILKNWANSAIWWFSTLVWTFWNTPEFIPNKFAINDIKNIETLIKDSETKISSLSESLSTADKEKIEKRLKDLIIELKEKKLAMLKRLSEEWTDAEKTQAKTDSLLVLWDLMNTNSKEYLEGIKWMETSMNELWNLQENYSDYIGVLTMNYGNIKTLQELKSVDYENLKDALWNDLPWMAIKTKAIELLKKFEDDFINNINAKKKEIDDKITEINWKITGMTLDNSAGITKEYKDLHGLVIVENPITKLAFFTNEYIYKNLWFDSWRKDNYNNLPEVLEIFVSWLGWSFDWGSAGIVWTLNDTEKALNTKKTKLQEEFEIKLTLPSDVNNEIELNNFVEEIKKLKKTVNWFEEIDWADTVKKRKLDEIDDKIKEIIVLFKNKLEDLWDDYNEVSKLNDLYIRTIWWNWVDAKNLDSSFVNLYNTKEEEIKEKIFQKMLEVKKFSELSEPQKRIIKVFIWDYKGKGNELDDYLKNILIDNDIEIIIKPDLTINQIIQLINGLQQFTTAKSLVINPISINDTNRLNLQDTADKLQSKIPWVLTWIEESIKWTMKWKLIELYNWMLEQAS